MTRGNPKADPAQALLNHLAAASKSLVSKAASIASCAASLWIVQAYIAATLIGRLISGNVSVSSIAVSGMTFVLVGMIRHGADAWAGRMAFREALKIVAAEREAIIHAQSLCSPFQSDRQSSATVATLIGTKLDQLIPWMTRYRIAAFKVRIVPLVLLAAVFSCSWAAGLVLLISAPLIPVFMALIGFAARDASEKHMAETGTLNAMLLEWLNAGVDIRLLNGQTATIESFDRAADSLRARTMAVLKIAFLSSTVLELFAALGIAMVAVYVGFSLLGAFSFGTYGPALTPAEGIFILLIVPDFFAPLRELAAAWHDRAAALAVAGEMAALRGGTELRILGRGAKALPLAGEAKVATEGLKFVTSAGREISFPNFAIRQGEKVAMIGDSGAGKSTLIGLLTGMVAPTQGQIKVAGRLLDDESADGWRQRFAIVSQHPHMLNASLRANVSLGEGRGDASRLADAIRRAEASDIVINLPRGMDSRLGENGSGVSGGEARRLTIARAIYKQADVIFADEPTADLDAKTADLIIDALLLAAKDGTSLIVATHDPRLIAKMDRNISLAVSP
jgi:ATP-binding cassette, subfamily C, bacterial CydD